MKIAMVSEHASPLALLGGVDAGGQNVVVAALSTELARMGATVTVHTRRDDPSLPRRVPFAPGVVVDHVEAGPPTEIPKDDLLPFMDQFAADLYRQWTRDRPDVVHAHFWMSGQAALAAARPLGVPVVQTFHAHGIVKRRQQGSKDTSPRQRISIEARIARSADRVQALCRDEVSELRSMGADCSRISVIPNGVDLDVFRPDGPVDRRRPGVRRVVVVGRLVERKGVGNVIAALRDVPGAELVIAGGPDREDLMANAEARRLLMLASRHGVADRVDLRGRVGHSQLPALLRSADVVVCAPWYEPFGIVPLEAMACGVPVVGSAVGGLLDTVVDGATGRLVPPRRPDAIAGAVCDLLADEHRRAAMGRAGLKRTRLRYGWATVAESILDAYTSVQTRAAVRTPGAR